MRDRKRINLPATCCQWNGTREKKLLQRSKKFGDTKKCSQMTPRPSHLCGGHLKGVRCAWTFFSQLPMFYLCTFSSLNLSAADTEVHLMKKCRYFSRCLCACCALHRVCSLYGPKQTKVNYNPLDQEQDTANFLRIAKDARRQMKVKGRISVSIFVLVCFVTMLFSVATSNAAVHPPG